MEQPVHRGVEAHAQQDVREQIAQVSVQAAVDNVVDLVLIVVIMVVRAHVKDAAEDVVPSGQAVRAHIVLVRLLLYERTNHT